MAINALIQGLQAGNNMIDRRRNMELEEREYADQQAQRRFQNNLVQQKHDAGMADQEQEQVKQFLTEGIRTLGGLSVNPAMFSKAADFYANHPIAKKVGITRESITPEAVQQLMEQMNKTGAGDTNVHSTFIADDGNMYVVPKQGTKPVNTGVKATKFAPRAIEVAGGKGVFNPNTQSFDQSLSSAGQEDAAARSRATQAGLGKEDAQRTSVYINEGLSAADSMPVINRAIELLDSVETGGIDAAKLAASNFFGVTGADEAELSNNLGKAVLSQLRATFGAQFTEREGARLQSLEAGFGKSTAGNKRILGQVKALIERSARRGMKAAEDNGDTFSAEEIKKSLSMSLTPQPAAGQPTKTATGPGGQKLGLINGQWVPLNGR